MTMTTVEDREAPSSRPAAKHISRAAINFVLDAWLLVNFVALLWLMVLLNVVFPEAQDSVGYTLWGHDYGFYARGAFATVLLLALSLLVHIILHWNWVCSFVRSKLAHWSGRPAVHNKATNTLYGVGLLIMILLSAGAALAVAEITITGP